MPASTPEQPHTRGARLQRVLTWLGGGETEEIDEPRQRSTHAIAGVVVLVGAALTWLVVTLAIVESTSWPIAAVLPFSLVGGVLVGAVSRAIAGAPASGWAGVAARTTVAVAVGAIVGELAAMVLLAGSIDSRLTEQAVRTADSAPAVTVAAADLERTRQARAELDAGVEQARRVRDDALVVARCEFNPSPACPETHITGVPGSGPETRTANDFLGDAERQLDTATAERDQRATVLDEQIGAAERALASARESAIAPADRGLGARWATLNDLTLRDPAGMLVRVASIGFFVLMILLPLILKQWRGETTHDRHAAARTERDRAELEADTAIAVKRAEVRAATELLWAEQQLASARLAAEAQTEIDREQQRRRVMAAIEAPIPTRSQRPHAAVDDNALPSAREIEDATPSQAELTAGADGEAADDDNLPVRVEPAGALERRAAATPPSLPTIPDVTKTAVRWIRPFVPPIVVSGVASAIETTTRPLRGPRQIREEILEEVEETHLTFTRTHKVRIQSENTEVSVADESPAGAARRGRARADRAPVDSLDVGQTGELAAPGQSRELAPSDHPRGLDAPEGPPQLPSGE